MVPRWLLWTLLALLCWGVWAILAMSIEDGLTGAQTQAISTLGMLPVIAALAARRPDQDSRSSRRGVALAFGGGLVSCLGNVTYFPLVGQGNTAAAATALTSLYPLVTIVLAAMVLREQLNRVQMAGIVLSLAAIYLFNVPQEGESGLVTWIVVAALAPIVLWGVSGLMQKMATNHLSARDSTLWFLAAFLPLGAWLAIREPWSAAVSPRLLFLAVAVGFTLALGNLAILYAFSSDGKASIIAPLGGLYPLISIPYAVGFRNEPLDPRKIAGIAAALVAVVLLTWESNKTSAEIPSEVIQ